MELSKCTVTTLRGALDEEEIILLDGSPSAELHPAYIPSAQHVDLNQAKNPDEKVPIRSCWASLFGF
jgi:hypothetical protein